MIRIIIDTSFWISFFGQRSKDQFERVKKARKIIEFLNKHTDKYTICYSERTKNELKNNPKNGILDNYTLINSHILNEEFAECDLAFDNIDTILEE